MAIHSVSSTTAIVPFLLEEDNYEDWRIYMENYLLAQDLWGIIESESGDDADCASSSNDENYQLAQDLWGIIESESGDDADCASSSNDVENRRKKNAAALHAIHITSSSNIFAQIKGISSAKDAWNKLAQMHQEWQSEGGGEEDEMTEDFRCVEFKKSICNGDWNAVKRFFVSHKHPLDTRIVSDEGHTALHVAIGAGQDKIAEELINLMSDADLEIKTASTHGGNTALSLAALAGRIHVAKCIVEKNNKLLTIEDNSGNIPVIAACSVGRKEMTKYLYSVTPPEVLLAQNSRYGFDLMRWSIDNKILDLCLDLLRRNPNLAITTNEKMQGDSPILELSHQPSVFFSGCTLRFWQIWIYNWLKVKLPTTSSCEVRIPVTHNQDLEEKNLGIQVFGRLRRLGLMLLNFFGIKQIYDLKLKHLLALEILRSMCNHVSTLKITTLWDGRVVDAMFQASKQGVVEFIIELLKVTLPLYYYDDNKSNVFMVAVQYRQESIFNLLYGVQEATKVQILNDRDKEGNNMLHLAGEIAPDFKLAQISSPALQMQKELQWFKEVERIVPEWHKEYNNKNGETPYEIFSRSHKELVKEGGKWMKDTAKSFIIVGTLIVTIMFAVAFTVPGGNNQNTGFPIFLQERSFMTFIISDAISFFAAATSVLMFLGILTTRFAQEDFLVSLPRKLIIGLSTLFISIVAMMVSFCAALLIMLQDRWWAILPIIMMASIPVALFVWLQFPLLVEIFVSTYAPRIFNRKMKRWL